MNVLDELRKACAPLRWRMVRVTVVVSEAGPAELRFRVTARCGGRTVGCGGYGPTRRAALADALDGSRSFLNAAGGERVARLPTRRLRRAAWFQ